MRNTHDLEKWIYQHTLEDIHELDMETVRIQHLSGMPTMLAFLDNSEESHLLLNSMKQV
jgi:hypothetical protein